MREMETGGKPLNIASAVRTVPNVIRVVMRPEVPPRRRHHHRHKNKHLGGLVSVLRLAEGLNKVNKGSRKNKTAERVNTDNALKETVQFLENLNGRLENMSNPHKNDNKKLATKPSNSTLEKGSEELMITDSFPLIPELRSIVEHGKPFNPDVTRAAFARAKQIVWDSVGQDPANTDVGHLNNTKLTNAVALLEMAVREAEKMQRNKTNVIDQGTSASKKIPGSSWVNATEPKSKHGAHELKILKDLLLEELKQTNYTNDKAGILISDIPFQKLRSNEQANLMQKLPPVAHNSSVESKTNSSSKMPAASQTQVLLEKYTSFITNILKAAHLSVLKNLTGNATHSVRKNDTKFNLDVQMQTKQPDSHTQNMHQQTLEQSSAGKQANLPQKQQGQQQLSFANAAQEEQQQQQQRYHQPFLSKERLAARKAFSTAQKLVKAFLARQELYRAEKDFFNKIHEMLNKTSSINPLTVGPVNDAKGSKLTSQPTVASPIQSQLSQSPINTAGTSASVGGEGNEKQTSEAQKKFEEAAHLEEKVAAQQDEMYDALMGHTIGTVKGDAGGFEEEGAIHETPDQDGVEDPYNTEDYGDFKDSDEEAERKFYHDHRQGDFEAKAGDDSSFSLRNRISSANLERPRSTELNGSGLPVPVKEKTLSKAKLHSSFGMSGDGNVGSNLKLKLYKRSNNLNTRKVNDHKTNWKAFNSLRS